MVSERYVAEISKRLLSQNEEAIAFFTPSSIFSHSFLCIEFLQSLSRNYGITKLIDPWIAGKKQGT